MRPVVLKACLCYNATEELVEHCIEDGSMTERRRIIHVDMDAFYASVEQKKLDKAFDRIRSRYVKSALKHGE